MGTKNDEVILKLKKEIEEKKSALTKVGTFKPVTNCSLDLHGTRYNLHVIGKDVILYLIAAVNSLHLGLQASFPNEQLILSGYPANDWLTDLHSKFTIVNVSAEKARLKTLEDRLHELLSVDTKIDLELENLKSLI